MADDDKEQKDSSFRGTDWEVVSLTASAYAASPGPKGFDPPDEEFNRNEQEPSSAMLMSNHFIFPPHGHENLPVDPDCCEIHNEPGSQDVNPIEEEFSGPNKSAEDNCKVKSDDDPHGIQFLDKGHSLSDHIMGFGEGKALEELTMVGKEEAIYVAPSFGPFHAGPDIDQSVLCDEGTDIGGQDGPLDRNVDCASDYTNVTKLNEENKYDGSDLPCEAWWRRQAISLYSHAKESTTFWSVFVAAALMGLVILGQQWQKEKLQLQQLKCQLSISDGRTSRMTGPLTRLKDILVGGHQRSLLVRGGAASNL